MRKKSQCENCKRSIPLTSDALASAALDQPTEMIKIENPNRLESR